MIGFPIRTKADGSHEVVKGIEHNEWAADKIKATIDELAWEKDAVSEMIPATT
jgi:hypothetical protein